MKLKLCTVLLTAATLFTSLSLAAQTLPGPAAQKSAALENFGKLPLSFEPTADAARFVAHSGGYSVAVEAREAMVVVNDAKSGKSQALRFGFAHASPAGSLEALEPQGGVTNYYLGSDPAKWRLGVKNYAKLRVPAVYPGIDVIYYGDHRRLEFDFKVAPKADPSVIALSFSGMDKLYKSEAGELVAEINGHAVRFAKPFAYQRVDGASKAVAVDYELASANTVHLRLGNYDSSAELIIDPVVSYALYLGGSQGDVANGIAVDTSGNAYVTGQTCSSDFPNSSSSIPPNCAAYDAYVTKYSADGTAYVYTTIIGDTNSKYSVGANAIALDSSNQAYITGGTNYPYLTHIGLGYLSDPSLSYLNNLNTWRGGDSDAFITILAADGSILRTSYLGGSGADTGYGIAVDSSNNVTVVGQTCSSDFPGYNAFETKIETCVAFIAKLDNNLDIGVPPGHGASALSPLSTTPSGTVTYFFSEFYGGQPVPPATTTTWKLDTTYAAGAIVSDGTNIEVALNAGTSSTVLPSTTTWTWATAKGGQTQDASILWENLGPPAPFLYAWTWAYGVALDPLGDVFIVGGTTTASGNLAPFSSYVGSGAWVLKVSGSTAPAPSLKNAGYFVYGTVLETNPNDKSAVTDAARAVAVDTQGRAYVTGTATGTVFTTSGAYQTTTSGGTDAFLVRINTAGSAIEYGTYLGGKGDDQGLGVAVDGSGAAYVTGSTQSSDFPIINPLTNPNSIPNPYTPIINLSGLQDAFVSKFTSDGTGLVFSAYLGGSDTDQGNAIALDTTNQGNMYVAGSTFSADFEQLDPSTYTAPQLNYGGQGDGFVAMIAGSSLPIVTVTPSSLSYGTYNVGTPSTAYAVKYFNTNTTSTVTIGSITFGGTNPGDFTQAFPGTAPGDCVGGGTVAPDTYCNIWVSFTPGGGGPRSATITITDGTSSTAHIVSLAGTGALPQVSFTPSSLTFPSQLVNVASVAMPITVQDTGAGILTVGTVSITGPNPGDAPSDFSVHSNNCTSSLTSGSSCTISIVFTPSALGTRNATLVVNDNVTGSPQKLSLTGSAIAVANTIAPTSMDYGQQTVNTTSATQTVTVQNTDSSQTLVISGVTITSNFKIVTNNCASVATSSSCTILVAFAPTTTGALTGTLTISGNGSGMPAAVSLTGTGTSSSGTGVITLSPTHMTFSTQANVTSSDQSVTLTNGSSTASLTITSMGIDNALFAIHSTTCGTVPFTLSASGTCTIKVNYTPVAITTIADTGTLTVASASSTGSVALSGTGTSAPSGTADFSVTPNATGVSLVQGGTAYFTLSVAPLNNFNSSIGFTCTSGYSCTFSPSTLTMDGTTTKTVALSINTATSTGTSSTGALHYLDSRTVFFALLPFSIMGMLLTTRRKNIGLVVILLVVCLAMGMVGCGASGSSSTSGGLAPGTYTLTVTATSTGTPVVTQPVTLSINVSSK